MAVVNLAKKFSKYVDEAFARESFLAHITNNNVKFTGVNEVSVYSIDPMPIHNYTKSGTNRYGTLEEIGDWVQTFTLTEDKSFTGSIDEGNAQDQNNIKGASTRLAVQLRDVMIPEMEKYVLKQWCYGAGKVVGGNAPTASTVLGIIQTAASFMNNNHVPKKNRTMLIKETYAAMLPNLGPFTYLEAIGSRALTENEVPRIGGFDVRPIPDSDMPANVYIIFQHKASCPFEKKLQTMRIQKNPMGVDGNVIEGRLRYWGDVLGNKCAGVYIYAASAYVQANPTISIASGTATVTAAGATIYYTLDGSDPRYSKSRVLIASGGTVTVPSGATIKAYGYTSAKYPSGVVSATNS